MKHLTSFIVISNQAYKVHMNVIASKLHRPRILAAFLFLVCAVGLLISGCAAVGKLSKEQDRRAKSLRPAPDKSLIYVVCVRRGGLFPVYCDGLLLGENDGGRYIFAVVDSGMHRLECSSLEKDTYVQVHLEGGRTYFFEQQIGTGLISATCDLIGIEDDDGARKLKRCYLSSSLDIEAAEMVSEGNAQVADSSYNVFSPDENATKRK